LRLSPSSQTADLLNGFGLAALPGGGTRVSWRIRLAGGRRQRLLYALIGARVRRRLRANIESFAHCVDSAA
jgi:hypothetical protein